MANLLPPTGHNANPLGPKHRTFTSLYNDLTQDPCHSTYSDILVRFDPAQNVAITHVLLLEQAIGAGVVPQAYLCCTVNQGQIKILCLHMPSRFTSSLDGRRTPWDGKVFAFLGELTQGIATTVELPDKAFCSVINIRTRTYEYICDHPEELLCTGMPYPE